MMQLMRANFGHLRKNKFFRVGMIVMASVAVFLSLGVYDNAVTYEIQPGIDNCLMTFVAVGPFVCAAFLPLFFGTAYSDGTIRNKLIVGHSRFEILISNFLTAMLTGILFSLCYLGAYLLMGLILKFDFTANPWTLRLIMILGGFVLMSAFSVLFTGISCICTNKALSAVICLILTLLIMMDGVIIENRLSQPEFHSDYVMTEMGEVETGEMIPNPAYVGGKERKFVELARDITFGGEVMEYSGMLCCERVGQIVLTDLGWILIFAGVTYLLFRKKDLK